MKSNLYRRTRQQPGGLYLIALRQRLARSKALRQQISVCVSELSPLKHREALLRHFSSAHAEPVEAA